MGDRAYRLLDDKSENAVSALFYIMNKEIAKPEDEMNTDLIEKCADAIPQIDDSYAVPEEQTDAFVKKMLAVYDEKHKSADEQPDYSIKITRKSITKRLKVILISAVIVVLLSGVVATSRINILSLLTNDLENHNAWENGEKRSLDNEDIVYGSDTETYYSFEDLVNDKNLDIPYPKELSNKYTVSSLFYAYKNNSITISAKYQYAKNYTVELLIYTNNGLDVDDNCKTEMINNHLYYFMSSDNGYQATAIINDYIYVFESNNEKALKEIIKKTK